MIRKKTREQYIHDAQQLDTDSIADLLEMHDAAMRALRSIYREGKPFEDAFGSPGPIPEQYDQPLFRAAQAMWLYSDFALARIDKDNA